MPDMILPAPCASSSLLVGVTLLSGSKRSVASTQSKVSKLATKAMVAAVIHTSTRQNASILGNTMSDSNPPLWPITGTETRLPGSTAHAPSPNDIT